MSNGSAPEVTVRSADLSDPRDQNMTLELLDMYARDPLGQGAPLSEDVRQRLIPGLQAHHPATLVLLAFDGSQPAGLAVCFVGYSTFRAAPILNIHDLAVRPESRGRNIGRALLQAVERAAIQRDCCKITLEVREDNVIARHLYQSFGFDAGEKGSSAHSFFNKWL